MLFLICPPKVKYILSGVKQCRNYTLKKNNALKIKNTPKIKY